MTRKEFLSFSFFTVASIFGVVGLVKELASHAATPTANSESENGSITVPATRVVDSTASGGSAVKFGSALTGDSRDSLVYGTYVPGPDTTGPIPGTNFTVLGAGPKFKGMPIYSYDDPQCPRLVPSASDWDDGTDYRVTITADGQIVENMELWGSIDLKNHTNVVIRNCIIHGDRARTGYAGAFIVNSTTYDDHKNLTVTDSRFIGRPIRIPDTYNGTALDAAGRIDACNQYNNGLRGSNQSIYRCELVRTPDGIGLTGVAGNWKIMGNWIHRHSYVEWTTHDSSSGPGGWYPTAAGGSTYTHADCIQFDRGKHIRICGNALGNYNGGSGSGDYAHNGSPTQEADILAAEDFYNSNFMIKQEVDSSITNQIQDVVIWKNFLGGSVSTINFPSSANGNPFPKRAVQDNWNDSNDVGIGIWHNRVRKNAGSELDFLVYPAWTDRFVDNLYDDGTAVHVSRSA
jgi:hypothetical protein